MNNKNKANAYLQIIAITAVALLIFSGASYGIAKAQNLKYQKQINMYRDFQLLHYGDFISDITDFKAKYLDKASLSIKEAEEASIRGQMIAYKLMSTVEFLKIKYDKQPFGLAKLYSKLSDFTIESQKITGNGQSTEIYKSYKEQLAMEIETFINKYPNLIEQIEQGDQSIFSKQ